MTNTYRALHFVLKIGNLRKNVEFFRDKLKMTVLRHEVFDEGCEAACNGPYANKWSKTMIGYGSEDDHFVVELTYNYSISGYKIGNDFQHIKIGLKHELFDQIRGSGRFEAVLSDCFEIESPDGYKFLVSKNQSNNEKSDIKEVCLSCTDLRKSLAYWIGLLDMSRQDENANSDTVACLKYSNDQASITLKQIDEPLDHKSAYGRIAFSCPSDRLKVIQKGAEDANQKVLTPFLSLDTPGKATVEVVILADPDGHEICFVGDEGFRQLSRVDPDANNLIEKCIADDKSEEWYEKRSKKKDEI